MSELTDKQKAWDEEKAKHPNRIRSREREAQRKAEQVVESVAMAMAESRLKR